MPAAQEKTPNMQEKIYLKFHPTKLAFLKWYLLAFIIIIVGIFVILNAFEILKFVIISKDYTFYTIFIPFIGVVFIIVANLFRRDDTYYITNYRIIEKKGIINIKEESINWEKVSNYSLTQTALERLFNIGTISLYSVGGIDTAEVTIKKVPNIHKINAFLDKLIERKGPVV